MTITKAGRIASNGLTGYGQETGNASGLTLVADPTGAAGGVLKAYLHKDDALAGGSHRSEVSTSGILVAVGAQGWYWWETYIPGDWVAGGNEATLWQVHDTADGGDPARSPPLFCQVEGDSITINSVAAVSAGDDNQVKRLGIWNQPLSKNVGRWVSWVVRATWNYTSGGALTVWKDRRMVFSESAYKNCFNDVAGLYPKFGVYVPVGLDSEISSRTVYHRGMVTGDNAYSTFDAFMAAAGSADTELESVFSGSMSAA